MPEVATKMSADLVSMTGHGEANSRTEHLTVSVEIRTVNNRYLKSNVRLTEGFSSFEPKIEEVLKKKIHRGSVNCSVKIQRQASPDDFQLNETVLISYRDQLTRVFPGVEQAAFRPELLLSLPGVINSTNGPTADVEEVWNQVLPALNEALDRLDQMRRNEGSAMADDLRANCEVISNEVEKVAARAGTVVESYQERLTDRLNTLLAKRDVTIESQDLAREVGMFADRCDISEEVVRLRSHLRQFEEIMTQERTPGKKLDFVTQEMFREVNTIGSKANDSEIARHVIEMKSSIERIREQVQNIE